MTVSLADMAQGFALRRQSAALKTEQQRLGAEMTTGVVADTAKHLRGNLTEIGAIDASIARLSAYKTANTAAAGLATATQTVLGSMAELADGMGTLLSDPSLMGSAAGVNSAAAEAHERFLSTVALLNTSFAGQPLFAGASGGDALAEGGAMLVALDAATAGARTAAELQTAVGEWFQSESGFGAFHLGEGRRAPIAIGKTESVTLDVTAADPALRDTLKALATVALLSRGALASDGVERETVAKTAGNALIAGREARLDLRGQVGSVEAHIARAATLAQTETAALSLARVGMVAADPYETAVRFEAASTQLETLHAVTARLSKLSLVDFL